MADVDPVLLSGLAAWLQHVLPYGWIGFGVWMFRIGKRVGVIEEQLERQPELNSRFDQRIADRERAHHELREEIAKLPTRDELNDRFAEVREDLRALRKG